MQRLLDQLIRDEGLRLKPYHDTVGKLTIGVGRNLDDVGISEAEARVLLGNDITRVVEQVLARWPWVASLDEARRAVIYNMAFNIGTQGLQAFKKMWIALTARLYDQAAKEMLDSKWATQVGARATRLAQQMRTGVWQ